MTITMDSGTITIFLTIITILIAVYIPYRQGIFHKPKLYITIGNHFLENRITEFIVVGLNNLNTDYYIVILEYLIENRSKIALKNILVQFDYDDFDCTEFKFADDNLNENKMLNYNIKRGVKHIHNKFIVELDIPLLTPETPLYVQECIVLKKSKFKDNKTNFEKQILENCPKSDYMFKELNGHIFAENHKPIHFKTWFLVTFSKNIDNLIEKTNWPTWRIFYKNCPKIFGRLYAKRQYPWAISIIPLCKSNLLYMQPEFITFEEDGKTIALQIEDKTNYEYAKFDMDKYQRAEP